MINPHNLKELSNELENTLNIPVSIKILEQLTEKQRNFLATLIHKWSQGEEVEKIIKIEEQALSPKEQDLLRFYLLQIARLTGENG